MIVTAWVILVGILLRLYMIHCCRISLWRDSNTHVSGPRSESKVETEKFQKFNTLRCRALANQRLCAVFGISNAFTNDNHGEVERFIRDTRNRLRLSSGDWEQLSYVTYASARHTLNLHASSTSGVSLVNLVQILTLRVVLLVLFAMDDEAIYTSDDNLVKLASEINKAWMQSKDPSEVHPFEDNISLQKSITAIFPKADRLHGAENPLNLILPGFETMWRISLRVFLEVGFKTGLRNPHWRQMLAAFTRQPTKSQFERRSHRGVSAGMLIHEALRLYPPTRRIYRAADSAESSSNKGMFAFDVEASHHATSAWGSTATEFKPERWTGLTPRQRYAFRPFGTSPVAARPTVSSPTEPLSLEPVFDAEILQLWKPTRVFA
ncbi:uncharacterized protein BDW47DRAFT_118970 [Aspergillus candidus]|uniref:Cytochrome P450 n=1 Tax=Aspergillus candidus TaxID=41067 RepID=A0A2I2F6C8_ASPCN|nr:hypothetical protein BDW47DRAFT_118970 [Aspergillus candidus]PLB36138.1 hypothetical protein BDW47DRAFT_118970 [Aspergillus candidus]